MTLILTFKKCALKYLRAIGAGIALMLLLPLGGCFFVENENQCERCHVRLELASESHMECVACHGGDVTETNMKKAHAGMYGPRNPSAPQVWEKTCGKCHPYQLERVRSNLMYTNTEFIKNIQLTWEGDDAQLYATATEELFDAEGNPVTRLSVAELDNLAGELYRKFCALCHIGVENHQVWRSSHASGCAACHFPFNENGTYTGNDLSMRGKWPHSETHALESLPDNDVCLRCHNRSGRMALTYQGKNDGNNSLVPTKDAIPGPELMGGPRNITSIHADIHHQKGMECIDCHTSRDVMGDGYAYENMYHQVEVHCSDCHGSATEFPQVAAPERENSEAVREANNYAVQPPEHAARVLTSKGRPYANVYKEGDDIVLLGKRDGKRHVSKVITNTPEHKIVGHERLNCYACHSRAVPQCFGCHTEYDRTQPGEDFVKQRHTRGKFIESEDYRDLYPFALALDQRGEISPVTPGCQTFLTIKDRRGEVLKHEYVAKFKGKNQLRFAPFYSHNTAAKAVGCSECHANPQFMGFGQHSVAQGEIQAQFLCEKAEDKPLDGFMQMRAGQIRAFSGIVREHSRPLNTQEIRGVFAVNQCLVCHTDPRDPIYGEKLDYGRLEECLRLAAAGRELYPAPEPR
ncbi:MAG: selenite/tellurite reduction operon c-type cytochrome ExtM [Desulfuromonas sp.]